MSANLRLCKRERERERERESITIKTSIDHMKGFMTPLPPCTVQWSGERCEEENRLVVDRSLEGQLVGELDVHPLSKTEGERGA